MLFALLFYINNLFLTGTYLSASTATPPAPPTTVPWTDRRSDQLPIAIQKMLMNIAPAGTLPGTVIASPSKFDPDYYYHWTRDSALVMNTVVLLYQKEQDAAKKEGHLKTLKDFAALSLRHQGSTTLTGLGEPRFFVDGRGYDGEWGRPQDDGPALRALTLIRLANSLLDHKIETHFVKQVLYDSQLPSASVIKTDLEYVAKRWPATSFDLWEEIKGHHFYTRLCQLQALKMGADLANRLNDHLAAVFYQKQATLLRVELERHRQNGVLISTIDYDGGSDYKFTNLDTSVILAFLHTDFEDSTLSILSPEVLATAHQLKKTFGNIYRINQITPEVPPAIGRYSEDRYYGGNPWYLTTLAFAEYYYKMAIVLKRGQAPTAAFLAPDRFRSFRFLGGAGPGQIITEPINHYARLAAQAATIDGLLDEADGFFHRVFYHLPAGGAMTEQISRFNGFSMAAPDLTWSYAAFITASEAYEKAH